MLAIYEAGIATGNATFETKAPDWATWDEKHLPDHRFVALDDDEVSGWIATNPTSDRCVYAGVVEESIYIAPEASRPRHRPTADGNASSPPPKRPASGRSKAASFPRTKPA